MHRHHLSLYAIARSAVGGFFWVTLSWLYLAAVPANAAELVRHTVTIDDHAFAIWEKSPPKAQHAVMLVHGRTWSSLPDFDLNTANADLSLMNALAAAGIAAYAIDMRGYGDTPRDATGWLTPNRAAADLIGAMQWLNDRLEKTSGSGSRAHLFGWSYGSMIAQLALQQSQQLATGLILFGYPIRRGITKEPPNSDGAAPARANTKTNAASDFITPGSIDQDAIDEFVQRALEADPIRTDWRELRQWRALDGRNIRTPTLLLQGEFDPLAKRRAHKRLMRRLNTDDKQWVVIKQGDHAAFMEPNLGARAQFLSVLTGFIKTH